MKTTLLNRTISILSLAVLFCFLIAVSICVRADVGRGRRGIISTVHPLATRAGIDAFKKGGNAIDAAVAAALTLGVVDGFNSGIGGGCFILIRLADGRFVAIDGRETAPLAASRNMYVRDGKLVPELSQTGALAAGVPGALLAYENACSQFGKIPLKSHLSQAADIAGQGFEIDDAYADRLRSVAGEFGRSESSRSVFFNTDGTSKSVGEVLRQPELARTYRSIARHGTSWFYNGPFALKTADWMAANGGILTAADFALYEAKRRQPIMTTYRGFSIVGFPPPSSGGVHVAQILNILETFDLKKMGAESVDTIHVIAEAMKFAFADRAFWLGDPDFVVVPPELWSKDYASGLAKRINVKQISPVTEHGDPTTNGKNVTGRHTTHFSTADAAGNWVACTATINTTFGSKVSIPDTGVILNNEMDDFAAQPGVPNFFGLVGSDANAIAPRKRPLSSMSPTIVFKNGKPWISIGAAGGPTIISQVVLAIVNIIDFEMDIETALAKPRFHHQWNPDELRIEKRAGEVVIDGLRRRGHKVSPVESIGVAQAVLFDSEEKQFHGAHDPRISNGLAAGW